MMMFIGALVSGIALSCNFSKHIDSTACQFFSRVAKLMPVINRLFIKTVPVEKAWGKSDDSDDKYRRIFDHQLYQQGAHRVGRLYVSKTDSGTALLRQCLMTLRPHPMVTP
jgi:hypothetical protein